jgi:hypothetical protein
MFSFSSLMLCPFQLKCQPILLSNPVSLFYLKMKLSIATFEGPGAFQFYYILLSLRGAKHKLPLV